MASPFRDCGHQDNEDEPGHRIFRSNPFNHYGYGILNPNDLRGPVYEFPHSDDFDHRLRNLTISPRSHSRPQAHPHPDRHASLAIQPHHDYSPTTPTMEFSTAAELLAESTDRAIDFFTSFQDEFHQEISEMEYATPQTTNQLWKNKIDFNERGHRRTRTPPRARSRARSRSRTRTSPTSNNHNQSTTTTTSPSPIFTHITRTLLRSISDFNHSTLPPLPLPCPSPHPTNTRPLIRKHKAALTLQRKIINVTADMHRYIDGVRTNSEDMQSALTEMETVRDLIDGFWRIWGGGGGGGRRRGRATGGGGGGGRAQKDGGGDRSRSRSRSKNADKVVAEEEKWD